MVDMKSEIRDGMQIDWDAPIAMDDGGVRRADAAAAAFLKSEIAR
jgi:hypothetical protein